VSWPTVTICRIGLIGYTLASGLHSHGWRCKNLSSRSFYIKLEAGRKVRRYDTTQPWGSRQLRGSTKSRTERVRPNVGKDRVWIFIVWWEEMEMRCCLATPGSVKYILPITLSTSVTPVSPYTHRHSVKMYLETVLERVWRCTWRPRSSELGWCTWRPWLIEFRDALWGFARASFKMHLQVMIERDWSSTWRRSIWMEARWQLRLYSLVDL